MIALTGAVLVGCSGGQNGQGQSGGLTKEERALIDHVLASVKRSADMSGPQWEQAAALGERAVPYLAERMRRVHGSDAQYVVAAALLGTNGTPAAVDALLDAMEDEHWHAAGIAAVSLSQALERYDEVRALIAADMDRRRRIQRYIDRDIGFASTRETLAKHAGAE
jgi:hypothetical protein